MNKVPHAVPVEVFETDTGDMMPLYRDWDEWHGGHSVGMVYATTLRPGTSKGPIFHKRQTGLITSVVGTIELQYLRNDVSLLHEEARQSVYLKKGPKMTVVRIPSKTWYTVTNWSNDIAVVVNMPDIAWRPDTDEKIVVDGWHEVYWPS